MQGYSFEKMREEYVFFFIIHYDRQNIHKEYRKSQIMVFK